MATFVTLEPNPMRTAAAALRLYLTDDTLRSIVCGMSAIADVLADVDTEIPLDVQEVIYKVTAEKYFFRLARLAPAHVAEPLAARLNERGFLVDWNRRRLSKKGDRAEWISAAETVHAVARIALGMMDHEAHRLWRE